MAPVDADPVRTKLLAMQAAGLDPDRPVLRDSEPAMSRQSPAAAPEETPVAEMRVPRWWEVNDSSPASRIEQVQEWLAAGLIDREFAMRLLESRKVQVAVPAGPLMPGLASARAMQAMAEEMVKLTEVPPDTVAAYQRAAEEMVKLTEAWKIGPDGQPDGAPFRLLSSPYVPNDRIYVVDPAASFFGIDRSLAPRGLDAWLPDFSKPPEPQQLFVGPSLYAALERELKTPGRLPVLPGEEAIIRYQGLMEASSPCHNAIVQILEDEMESATEKFAEGMASIIEGVNDGPLHEVTEEWLEDHTPADWVRGEVYADPTTGMVKVSHSLYLKLVSRKNHGREDKMASIQEMMDEQDRLMRAQQKAAEAKRYDAYKAQREANRAKADADRAIYWKAQKAFEERQANLTAANHAAMVAEIERAHAGLAAPAQAQALQGAKGLSSGAAIEAILASAINIPAGVAKSDLDGQRARSGIPDAVAGCRLGCKEHQHKPKAVEPYVPGIDYEDMLDVDYMARGRARYR